MVDDLPENTAGARSVGMHAIVVGEDPDPAIAEIRALVLGRSPVVRAEVSLDVRPRRG
ncbi:MAG: hypothetical protein OES13_09280 [Acidimicrobiia bacterium]|nr:hypothetical protein [Acidimicrobiia bacterium]